MDKQEEISELTAKLKVYQDTYYKQGVSLVSDSEYDRLFDKLSLLEKEYPEYALADSPTQRVGSDLTNDFPEVEHTIPVLSLDKAYSEDEVQSFFSKSIQKEGGELAFVAEEKIDGISMVLYYEDGVLTRAVTRGNGEIGNDVTPNIKTMRSVPLSLPEAIDIAVRGEVYLPVAEFNILNQELNEADRAANPRNLAAGTVRRQKSAEAARVPLKMFCYEGFWQDKEKTPPDHLHILSKLKELGFPTNPNIGVFSKSVDDSIKMLSDASLEGKPYSFDMLEQYLKMKTEERPKLPYDIDGLVFKVNELDARDRFGYTEHHPRWAIAYKFESPQAEATLRNIVCQVGRTGRITPVAEFSPTKLGGSTISRATLHNQEYIDQLELAIGDTISIVKRGDVIPAVEEVIEKNEKGNTTFKMPEECPVCHTRLVKDGAHEFCPNYDCPEQVKGRISYFASRDQMDIETLGPKTVDILYNEGLLESIEDIYSADYDSLIGKPGIGQRTIELLKKGIAESRNRPYKTVLASLGIPDIAGKNAAFLSDAGFDSLYKLIQASDNGDESVFTSVKGIGTETAKTLISAFKSERLRKTIASLTAHGLHTSAALDEREESVDDSFAGTVWVATGSFEHFNPRSKALAEIEKRGGRTSSSVTSKTTHLLAGKGGGSKRSEAEKLGVQIVSESEFLWMLDKDDESGKDSSGQGMLF